MLNISRVVLTVIEKSEQEVRSEKACYDVIKGLVDNIDDTEVFRDKCLQMV